MGFKLVRLDVVGLPIIPLQVGSHIIGRHDSLLNCGDQRVSRIHAMIKVSDDTVILHSLHQNPCFYNKLCFQKPLVLSKGEWAPLCNTDQFGLLPDSYWYEIILCDDIPIVNKPEPVQPEMDISNTGNHRVTFSIDFDYINPPIVSEVNLASSYYINQYPHTYNPDGDKESDSETLNLEFEEMDEGESQSLITSVNPPLENPNTPSTNNQSSLPPSSIFENTNCDDQTISNKRSHAPEHSYDAKKVKKEPESPNEMDNPTTEPNGTVEAQPVLLQNPVDANIVSQNIIDTIMEPQSLNYVNTATQNPTYADLSPEVYNCYLSLVKGLAEMERKKSQVPGNVNTDSESAYEADTDADPSPKVLEPADPSLEVSEPQNHDSVVVKKEPQTPDDKKNINKNPDVAVPGSSHDKPGCSNDAGTGGAPAKQPDRPRERCMYGTICYRRNPQHKIQFSHPSDADYGTGDTGQCPYGASCRRRDPRHWLTHDHPPGIVPPLPPQQGNPVKKRQRKVVKQPSASEESDRDSPSPDLILDGKRKRKTLKRERWSDSEEEDQDPYATDESDDWKPDSDVNKM